MIQILLPRETFVMLQCYTKCFFFQILGSDIPSDASPLPLNFYSADGSFGEETAESLADTSKPIPSAGEQYYEAEQLEDKTSYDLPAPYDMDVRTVKHEYIGETSNSGSADDFDYLLDEPLRDSSNDLPYGNGGYFEANDLSNAVETNTSAFDMLEEYLTFSDANDDNREYFTYDTSMVLENADLVSTQALLLPEVIIIIRLEFPHASAHAQIHSTLNPFTYMPATEYRIRAMY